MSTYFYSIYIVFFFCVGVYITILYIYYQTLHDDDDKGARKVFVEYVLQMRAKHKEINKKHLKLLSK